MKNTTAQLIKYESDLICLCFKKYNEFRVKNYLYSEFWKYIDNIKTSFYSCKGLKYTFFVMKYVIFYCWGCISRKKHESDP